MNISSWELSLSPCPGLFVFASLAQLQAMEPLPHACLFGCKKDVDLATSEVRLGINRAVAKRGLAVLARRKTTHNSAEVLRSQQFFVNKAKNWIQNCLAGHGKLCGQEFGPPVVAVRGMKVIDCETLAITPMNAARGGWP